MDEAVEQIAAFTCAIADTSSAFKISNNGDGRIQFDVPESEFAEIIKLMAFGREKALRVVVEV